MANDNIASTYEGSATMSDIEGRLRRGCADMTGLCQGSLGAAVASSQAAICGAQEITGALLAFLQSRAKDGLTAGQQLATCDSPAAAAEIQLEYTKAMLQAWADEFARLHALTGKIMADVWVPAKDRAVVVPEIGLNPGAGTLAA
jgi:hypothetical protein